jgi:hypothetical protein
LWRQEDVVAIWIGGSLARGDADEYSDVDLRVAVKPSALADWRHLDVGQLWPGECLAHQFLPFGERAFLHHVLLESGEIYDLWIQNLEDEIHDSVVKVIDCRDLEFAERLNSVSAVAELPYPAADGDTVQQILVDYWLNTHKHRKVLHRGLDLVALTGVQLDCSTLLRLWYVQATGRDCGLTNRQTIHGLTRLTNVVARAQGRSALEILGTDLSSRVAICHAIELVRDKVAEVGRTLAARLGFAYPEKLEQTVRRGWEEFLKTPAETWPDT